MDKTASDVIEVISDVADRRLFIAMEHTCITGKPKIVNELSYQPTCRGRVEKIFTDLAVTDVTENGLALHEAFPGLTEEDIQSITGPRFVVSHELKDMKL